MARRNDAGDLVNWYRGLTASIEESAQEELRQTVEDGAQLAIGYIATRGTAKSGKQGRIETGHMISQIKHRIDRMTDGRLRGFFGWLDAFNDPDNDYFVLQEGGFNHRGGVKVEGMYAIADAADQAFMDLQARVPGMLKRTPSRGFLRRMKIMGN